jgi:hypothetical protein
VSLARHSWRCVAAITGLGPRRSACDCGQVDGWIIAQGRDGFQRHVAIVPDRPFIALFEQERSDETDDGMLVGEDADAVRCLISPRPTSDILQLQVDQVEKSGTGRRKARSLGTGGWLIANYFSDQFRIKREPNSFLNATKGYVSAICHFQ